MTDAAEKRSKRRQRMMLAGALILLTGATAGVNAFAEMDASGPWRPVVLVRVGGLLALSLVLALRSTTAFSLLRRDPALDDELTRAHRAAAARFGFWAVLLGAIACLAASLFGVAMTLQEALLALIAAGAMCAALRFSILERRADG